MTCIHHRNAARWLILSNKTYYQQQQQHHQQQQQQKQQQKQQPKQQPQISREFFLIRIFESFFMTIVAVNAFE